jgi:hypothetical protein
VHAQTLDLGEGFLCCNMRTNGTWVSDSNYQESGGGTVRVGTPREQVLMAVGYPISSENPSLGAKVWRY